MELSQPVPLAPKTFASEGSLMLLTVYFRRAAAATPLSNKRDRSTGERPAWELGDDTHRLIAQ
jgi:hypothetical protein